MRATLLGTCLAFVLCTALSFAAADIAPVDVMHLKPGEYVWHPELAPQGPVVIVVSVDEQRVYVYRNGIAIGLATISSGRKGRETPPGIYTILEKDRDHYSNLYDNARMPFMERLTWDGVALHGGSLPGYPASHGCVRLPEAFAERLFATTRRGDTVVVATSKVFPTNVVHPAMLAPVGLLGEMDAGFPFAAFAWEESPRSEGPVSVLVSLADHRAYVLRNGVRIGSAPVDVSEGFAMSGTLLLVVGEGYEADVPSRLDPSRPRHRWSTYPIGMSANAPAFDDLATHLRVSESFARALYPLLTPGTTLILTDFPAVGSASSPQPVLMSEPR